VASAWASPLTNFVAGQHISIGTNISNVIVSGGGGGFAVSTTAWKNNANATSVGVTVAPSAGNACVVIVDAYLGSSANHAVSDNIDGTTGWHEITNVSAVANCNVSAWVNWSMPAGVTTITCTAGGGAQVTGGIVHEVSGGISTFTSGEAEITQFLNASDVLTAAILNHTAASVFFAVQANATDGNPITMTINSSGTTGGTWVLADNTNSQETDATDWIAASVVNMVVSTSASRSHAWSGMPSSDGGGLLIFCLH